LVKSKERVQKVCADIVKHFKEKVEPNGFKGQVVVYDREACDLYKQELDRHMPPEETAVVMTQPPHQGIHTQNYSVAKRYGFWRPHQWIHTQIMAYTLGEDTSSMFPVDSCCLLERDNTQGLST